MSKHLIKELETVVSINGNEVAAVVRLFWDNDDDYETDMDFENEEEKEKFERRLARGDILYAVLFAEVCALGETGEDILGGVLVEKPEDMDTTIEEYNMIETATDELIKAVTEKYEALKPYFQAA